MTNKKTLYYFTNSFPYGLGETWKLNELNILVHEFDEIHLIPLSYERNKDNPKTIPNSIILHKPLIDDQPIMLSKLSIFQIFDKNIVFYLRDFFRKQVFLDKKRVIKWLISIIRIKKILANSIIKELIDSDTPNTCFYFFWGVGPADMIPIFNRDQKKKILVRMHRFDLFENEVGNYIPFRKSLLKHATIIAPCSDAGKLHLNQLYPNFKDKVSTIRLGVLGKGKATQKHDGIFRIVTCSYISKVKRLDILAKALLEIPFEVEWTHIGDGPLRKNIEEIINQYPAHINVKITGLVDSRKVQDILAQNSFNLFINVSQSEGVPISIMEALSCSIPVMATDVGGTAEIVNDHLGKILPKNIDPKFLANELTVYNALSIEQKNEKAKQAYEKYLESCNTETLTKDFIQILKGM